MFMGSIFYVNLNTKYDCELFIKKTRSKWQDGDVIRSTVNEFQNYKYYSANQDSF